MDEYIVGEYVLENSRSRTGRHRLSSILLIYSEKGLLPINKASERIVGEEKVKPTYSRGEARKVKVKVVKGEYIIYAWFVKNFLGKVKGYIEVYSYKGELLYRAKYFDGVIRKSKGNPIHSWLVQVFVEKYRLPVKKQVVGGRSV